jgi:hypothetical protein
MIQNMGVKEVPKDPPEALPLLRVRQPLSNLEVSRMIPIGQKKTGKSTGNF